MIIDENNYKRYLRNGGKTLVCFDKGITEIRYLPEGLKYLFCWNNKLTYLPELPESLIHIDCCWNPNLPYADCYDGKEEIKELRNRINMDLYLEGKI